MNGLPWKCVYERDLVSTWKSIVEVEEELHPLPRDPFHVPSPGAPNYRCVKVPPYTQCVYLPGDSYPGYLTGYPFHPGDIVLYLGGVVHMGSHGVFSTRDGRVVWGYHTWDFRVIPEDYV